MELEGSLLRSQDSATGLSKRSCSVLRKQKKVLVTGHQAEIGSRREMRNAYKVLVGMPDGKV
jgi:hypothetical protein